MLMIIKLKMIIWYYNWLIFKFFKSFKEEIKEDNLYLFDLKDLENITY